jgi:hypothetical protein
MVSGIREPPWCRVLPSADDEIVESGRERLTADLPSETGVSGGAAPEGKKSENGRDRLSCSNVANAISCAISAIDLGRPDLARLGLLEFLRDLWGLGDWHGRERRQGLNPCGIAHEEP